MMKFKLLSLLLFFSAPLFAQVDGAKIGAMDKVYVFDGDMFTLFGLKELKPTGVKVSSTLSSSTNRYKKENIMDGKETTAWVEGKKGDGIGEKVTFTFGTNLPPDVIIFTPGYKNGKQAWYNNNRVAKVKVRFLGGDDSGEPNAVLEETTVDMPIDDKGLVHYGQCSINLSGLYLQNMAFTEFGKIEIEILAVDDKIAKYDDTCISEIKFMVRDYDKLIKTITQKEFLDEQN